MQSPTQSNVSLRGWIVLAVLVHAVVAFWHGAAHLQVPVVLSALQQAFVAVVIVLLPFVGLALLWSRQATTGLWIITASMFTALLFGLINHFVLNSPDNVMRVPIHPAQHSFMVSAALVAVTETMGTIIGLLAVVRHVQE